MRHGASTRRRRRRPGSRRRCSPHNPAAARRAGAFCGPQAPQLECRIWLRFYHDHVLVKEGRTRQHTPWHQDQPYYNVDGWGISTWIPVDRIPEAGCLELVASSHRGPWLMPRTLRLPDRARDAGLPVRLPQADPLPALLVRRRRRAPCRWRTSSPFDGLDREIAAGTVMNNLLFPVTWPA
ncbi:MAG: phytanoyl-CoA dioxygenase family protein [Streptosporangiaceae bacterium]